MFLRGWCAQHLITLRRHGNAQRLVNIALFALLVQKMKICQKKHLQKEEKCDSLIAVNSRVNSNRRYERSYYMSAYYSYYCY